MIEIGKTYIKEPYDIGGEAFVFTPNRPAEVTYDRIEEYGWANGGVFTSGFYCDKLVEKVHLWLNKETNTCIELIERKDYEVNIGFFGNGWKLKRGYIEGPRKYTIKVVLPEDCINDMVAGYLLYSWAYRDSILNKYGLPKGTKRQILEFIGENVESQKTVYEC